MKIRVSWGTAEKLGLVRSRGGPECRTGHLLTPGRCSMTCAFCPQARTSHGRSDQLSRVIWPMFELDEVVGRLGGDAGCKPASCGEAGRRDTGCREANRGGVSLERICIQAVEGPDILVQISEILETLQKIPGCPPISVSFRPRGMEDIDRVFALGASRVGIALDAATPQIYEQVKGHHFERSLDLLCEAARRYPARISTHFIVGLGETEEEMVRAIQRMKDIGVTVGLFAFTPVRGTPLADRSQPELASYRRIQAALYLIINGRVRAEDFTFECGRIAGFGMGQEALIRCLSSGDAFRTSGCPGCDRPYYNEMPGGPIYNYWRPLSEGELREALAQAGGAR